MATLHIKLMGGFETWLGDRTVTGFRSAKARALLAYLAMAPDESLDRGALADLLWGQLPESAARTNLRIELSAIKRQLGGHAGLVITRQTVRLASDALKVDATACLTAFERHAGLLREPDSADWDRLSHALDRCRGRFLADLHVAEALGFEDWRRDRQMAIDRSAAESLIALQRHHAACGQWKALTESSRRHLEIDPWNEESHRFVMQALAALGDTGQALAQYETCRAVLASELGIAPDADTEALAARLRAPSARPPRLTNLGSRPTSIIGRNAQIEDVARGVLRERMTTLLGLGGVGKTRVAWAVGEELLGAFPDGVWFVPLAPIATHDPQPVARIALAIGTAMGLQPASAADPLADLMAELAGRHVLLILDNWEQLPAPATDLIEQLLQHDGLHVLATSRRRLGVPGERICHVQGLPADDARRLYVERARTVFAGFEPTAEPTDESDAVDAICEAVAGLPLGLELAASWAGEFTAEEIRRSIASIGVEPGHAHQHEIRHHDLSGVLTMSWRLLTPTLRRLLAMLTVFRGSFGREAAVEVADATPDDLALLCSHSLLERVAPGRYGLHPLVEEFASARPDAPIPEAAGHRHRRYYLGRVAAREGNATEIANIRKAWISAVPDRDASLVERAATEFATLLAKVGLMQEGFDLFAAAVAAFEEDEGRGELVALLLGYQWIFSRAVHGLPKSDHLQFRLLTLSRDPAMTVDTHLQLANRFAEEGCWAEADGHFDQADELAKAAGNRLLEIETLRVRAHVNALHFRGDTGRSLELVLTLRAEIAAEVDRDKAVAQLDLELALSLALLACRHGDYGLAVRTGRSNLAHAGVVGHRQKRCQVLLDLALSEQFCGQFDSAIEHNHEALLEAEAIGALDDVGLLNANLCMVLRKAGDPTGALDHGKRSVAVLHRLGLTRMEGMARNRVGHALIALGRWSDAEDAYLEAIRVWTPLAHSNVHEARTGRAVALARMGRLTHAQGLADDVLTYVLAQGTKGFVEPILLLWGLSTVYGLTGRLETQKRMRMLAEKTVARTALLISDECARSRYLQAHAGYLRVRFEIHG